MIESSGTLADEPYLLFSRERLLCQWHYWSKMTLDTRTHALQAFYREGRKELIGRLGRLAAAEEMGVGENGWPMLITADETWTWMASISLCSPSYHLLSIMIFVIHQLLPIKPDTSAMSVTLRVCQGETTDHGKIQHFRRMPSAEA